ncbi:ABC transporter substrate-binding protein [Nocardia sp. 348MFTsu5.1]|uniref:ABC transporter substrate-binding protein n=1 Tax=Nocardia sp. 348MFTsu5.1 TaxID=1172185 RepID=UPI00037CF57E|nr:ABC transporter substrate-binding protein [Nocardia sp. 348MFTsu5.1]
MRQHIRPRSGRWKVAGALALMSALVATACSSGSSDADSGPSGEGQDPVRGGTLDIAYFPDNPTFSCVDPFQTYWIEHRSVIRNVADSLTDQNPDTGEIVPWLASKWEISTDGLDYTFTLRDGVTFSDGAPLDAAAVKTNFDAFVALAKSSSGTAFGASYILGLESTTVVDPQTVTFHFTQPNSSFLQATSTTNLALLSPASFQKTSEERCLGNFAGSGLFVLDNYTPGQSLTLSRRAGYNWGSSLSKNTGEAYLDAVKYTYVAEDSVRTGNLVSGAVDIAWPRNPLTVEDQELIKSSGGYIEARSLPGVSNTLFPNVTAGKPLSDPKVRQALYQATDLSTNAATVFGPDYPVVAGAFNSTTPYFQSQADKLGFDPDAAGQALDAAGWTLAPGSQYRAKDGKQLTLTLPVVGQFAAGNELLQDQWRQVGIDLQLKVVTQAEAVGIYKSGDYDLVGTYFTRADPGALQFILVEALANQKALAHNATTPEVAAQIQQLFVQATQTTDEAQTKQAYDDLQALLIDQGVTFPLFERQQLVGLSNKVNGFRFTSESFMSLNDTWIQQ